MVDFIDESSRLWDEHARRDPLWAILSDPARKGGGWDLGRFMQTGVGEVAALLYQLQTLGLPVPRGRALDFGCGVGRLSQALAVHFDRVDGVDVSAEMVERANALNRHAGKVVYHLNRSPGLPGFADGAFDFVLSNIVLQHVRPDHALGYVREFCRVLAPGGVLVFQLPSHRRPADQAPAEAGPRAMPDDAYVAAIAVLHLPEEAVMPGAQITLQASVSNRSAIDWRRDQAGLIRLGNHWCDSHGGMLVRDDGRTELPEVVPAGGACHLPLVVRVPADAGRYSCELDLAHEGVTWFHDKGSPRTRLALDVGGAAPHVRLTHELVPVPQPFTGPHPGLEAPDAVEPEDFPMYSVPTDQVLDLLAGCGLTLRHREEDSSCGKEWVSYRYFVGK